MVVVLSLWCIFSMRRKRSQWSLAHGCVETVDVWIHRCYCDNSLLGFSLFIKLVDNNKIKKSESIQIWVFYQFVIQCWTTTLLLTSWLLWGVWGKGSFTLTSKTRSEEKIRNLIAPPKLHQHFSVLRDFNVFLLLLSEILWWFIPGSTSSKLWHWMTLIF